MRSLLFLIMFFLIFIQSVLGQHLVPNTWNDYEGKLGSTTVRMSLYLFDDGSIKRNYCYLKSGKRIPLSGMIKDQQIELTEWLNEKPNGYLTGYFFAENVEGFSGKWTSRDSSKKYDVNLTQDAVTYAEFGHRYKNFKASDLMVEEYARQIKTAILTANKVWLANQLNYPLKTSFGDQKTHIIKSKADFIANFSKIFYPNFVERIKKACTCNLFYDDDGAMLGAGDIWIEEYVHPPKGKKGLFILGINN